MIFDNTVKNPKDNDYRAFRDEPHLVDQKEFILSLWEDFKPYADPHFKSQITRNFTDRFWEMYLTCTLLRNKFNISSPKKGPDIKTKIGSQKTWVEAICPGHGTGEDAVPSFENTSNTFPGTEIILRFTHAIRTKYRKLQTYKKQGIVDNDEAFIIAINVSKIDLSMSEGWPPRILKAVFPLGFPIYSVDIKNRTASHERFGYQPDVPKKSGTKISTKIFKSNQFSEISGILYSIATPFYNNQTLGQDFIFVHNPNANNPIPRHWLKLTWKRIFFRY